MRIGELATLTGVSAKTIRYYEGLGLVPPPRRSANGYRDYDADAAELLRFVRDAQATGLTLSEIGWILESRREGRSTCAHVVELLDAHLQDVDRQLRDLRRTQRELAALAKQARALDPAACTDPIRCQTIEAAADARRTKTGAGGHRHRSIAPHGHD